MHAPPPLGDPIELLVSRTGATNHAVPNVALFESGCRRVIGLKIWSAQPGFEALLSGRIVTAEARNPFEVEVGTRFGSTTTSSHPAYNLLSSIPVAVVEP